MEISKEFGDNYPCGPCEWIEGQIKCSCGWIYKESEVFIDRCKEECEVCDYCGSEKCPKCNKHLHCGGCI